MFSKSYLYHLFVSLCFEYIVLVTLATIQRMLEWRLKLHQKKKWTNT